MRLTSFGALLLLSLLLSLSSALLLKWKTSPLSRVLGRSPTSTTTRRIWNVATRASASSNEKQQHLPVQQQQQQQQGLEVVACVLASHEACTSRLCLDTNPRTNAAGAIAAGARGLVLSILLSFWFVVAADAYDGNTGETAGVSSLVVAIATPKSANFQLPFSFAPPTKTTSAPVRLNSFDILGRLTRLEENSLTKQDALMGSAAYTAFFTLVAFFFRAESKAEAKAMVERMEKRMQATEERTERQRQENKAEAKATEERTEKKMQENKVEMRFLSFLTLFITVSGVVAPIYFKSS